MKKLSKFFSYEDGGIVLHPPFMGSDSWSLRSSGGNLLFSVEDFLDYGYVFLEDGEYVLRLVELDDFTCFYIEFVVKGRQIIIEDVVCRNAYKRSYYSVLPDKGMYIL